MNFVLDSNEFLGDPGLAALRPLLAGRLSGRLGRFAFGSQLTAEGARSLVALMADGHFAELVDLDLSDNRGLGDEGAWAIAGALSEGLLPKLQELRLRRHRHGRRGRRRARRGAGRRSRAAEAHCRE